MYKYMAGAATTEGGTTKTTLGELSVPMGAKKIAGAWCYVGVIDTTIEQVSGICELESPDVNLLPCQFPITPGGAVTSGARSAPIITYPMDIPVKGGEKVTGYLTLDGAMTGNPKARFGLVLEM